MTRLRSFLLCLAAIAVLLQPLGVSASDDRSSTRVDDPNKYQPAKEKRSYRGMSELVLRELDLKPGDVVVDIGAGDGWWAAQMAPFVGEQGSSHAAEVTQKLVDKMKDKYAELPQLKPYLCPKDGPGLPENSCDMAFTSKSYHHLDRATRVDYLRGLREVLKPTGRLVVAERYPEICSGMTDHAVQPSVLTKETEEAGWILARFELLAGTQHYLAVFVQKDLFPKPKKKPPAEKEEKGS